MIRLCIAFFMITLSIMDEFDFSEINNFMQDNQVQMDFGDMVEEFASGENDYVIRDYFNTAWNYLTAQFAYEKNAVLQILFIGVASAFLSSLAGVFDNRQIADTGFFVAYILMAALLMRAFDAVIGVASDMVSGLLDFMRALIPSYFLSMSLVSGTVSSLAFYELMLGIIAAVDWLFLNLVIPMIRMYIAIMLVNYISSEDLLSRMAGLFQTGVRWCLRTLLGLVMGFNIIESMVLPGVDAVKKGTIERIISFLPGIGEGADALSQVLLGSGMLIKNGIGAAALIVILLICGFPVMKLAVFSVTYQFTAALIQPLADGRMTGSISCVAEGGKMLLEVTMTVTVLFFFTIAILCVSTNLVR